MSFSPEELELIRRAEEVEIETQAPDGPVHRTVIWAVVDDERVFIRSVDGSQARWYREAQANPAVALHVEGRRLTATAIPATDPDSVQRTSDRIAEKYAGDPSTDTMLREEVLDTTLRLEPT
ncbi:MAG TPA: nitroreductase/quinone reductase family protein [Vitreimonas sp.]|nr:nitroreductase/quinone reductase family protein [Vitreimonas sp.]